MMMMMMMMMMMKEEEMITVLKATHGIRYLRHLTPEHHNTFILEPGFTFKAP
jgi:hypothetical protein